MSMQSGFNDPVNPEDAATFRGALPRRSLVDDVYEHLIELLLDENFEPGARLSIDGLARAWQVSQTPVREALVRAEASGLVVREALKGYQVAPLLPVEEFEKLMELRLLIEPHCAGVACAKADANTLDFLEHQQAAMSESPKGPTAQNYREYLRADIAFHEAITAAADNRFLTMALSMTGTHAHRFRRFGGGVISDAPDALKEHFDILTAFRAHDAAAATAAMRRHLIGVTERGRAGS